MTILPREHVRLAMVVDAIGGEVSKMITLEIPGNPQPKLRHRQRIVAPRGRKPFIQSYADPDDVVAETRTAHYLRLAFSPIGMATGNLCLVALFYRESRQPIDGDNMLKHVCDAGNGVSWVDDSQITGSTPIVELDAANPRSVLAFAPHRSTMLRGTDAVGDCRACGRPRDLDRLFCSTECAGAGRRKGFVPYGTVTS